MAPQAAVPHSHPPGGWRAEADMPWNLEAKGAPLVYITSPKGAAVDMAPLGRTEAGSGGMAPSRARQTAGRRRPALQGGGTGAA